MESDSDYNQEHVSDVPIREDEELQDLLHGKLKILQKKNGYHFSVDPLLLTAFVEIKDGDRVIDLGVGSGVMPIVLATRSEADATYVGLEVQSAIAEMAERSVAANKLTDRIRIHRGDMKNVRADFPADSFDVVISNPPYVPVEHGTVNSDDAKALARHEILVKLPEVVAAARHLVRSRGRVYFIYPVMRLIDLLCRCRENKLEPRRLRFIHANQASAARLAMVEAVRDVGAELKTLRPLFVYNMEGEYTEEVAEILNEHDKLR
jgi:tRNA1Val (adenine37-N6)-methyltransferase